MNLNDHKVCPTCNKTFSRPLDTRGNEKGKLYKQSITLWSKRTYCSSDCVDKSANNAAKNESHGSWKGNSVSYAGLHRWVRRNFGRPESCENCGRFNKVEGRTLIDYASKDGLYTRLKKDWLKLCRKCHKSYDLGRITI
jgi:hypothetical protein